MEYHGIPILFSMKGNMYHKCMVTVGTYFIAGSMWDMIRSHLFQTPVEGKRIRLRQRKALLHPYRNDSQKRRSPPMKT